MAYDLGIDVGTTFTAAAISRDGVVEVVPLTTYQVSVPSVVFAAGHELLFGGAAERRGAAQPQGLAREFKRRVGDPVPLMLSGSPYHADRLTALMAQWTTGAVAEQIGATADRVVITHPANWTEYQLGTLRNALGDVGLGGAELISEPAAAAIDYAAVAALPPDSSVLVYDLGGGTFDVALLRRQGATFEHVVEPSGIERLGGIDFDEAVFQFAIDSVPREVLESARQRPEAASAITQLRRRCVDAKEALSSDAASDIPVMLPDYTSTVRITRGEFEAMIRPSILQTIELVQRTLERAQLDPGAIHAALLVGGSSRIPLVSQLVGEHLDVPVRIDAHPKLVTARGAARKAAAGGPVKPVEAERGGSRRGLLLLAGGAVAAAAAAAALFIVLGGDDEPSDAGGTTTPVAATSGGADDDSVPVVFPTAGEPIPTNVLIFTRLRSDGTRQLWSLDVERSPDDPQRTRRLATGLGSTWDNLPAISPDRRLIAYTTEQAGRFVLAVAAWDGGERLLLMDGEPVAVANDARATWSSDGTKLAYVANRGGSDDLYVYDATTQSERRLTDDDFSEADPSWSPTADEILYTVEAADTGLDIMRLPAAGGTAERVTAEPGDDSDPSWSPDGAEIAFTRRQSAEGAPSELFLMDRDGTRIRRLIDPAFDTGSPLKDDADPSWSPDGARIAFESARNEGLWVVDAAGQRDPEPLADDDTWILVHPAWR